MKKTKQIIDLKYKGIFANDDEEPQYFEGGAHFSFKVITKKLEKIILTLSPERRGSVPYKNLCRSKDIPSDQNTKPETRKIASGNSKEIKRKENDSKLDKKMNYTKKKHINLNGLGIDNPNISKDKRKTMFSTFIKQVNIKETKKEAVPVNSKNKLNQSKNGNNSVRLSENKRVNLNKSKKFMIDLNSIKIRNLNKTQKSVSNSFYKQNRDLSSLRKIDVKKIKPLNESFSRNQQILNSSINKKGGGKETSRKNKNSSQNDHKIINTFTSIINVDTNKSRNNQQQNKSSMLGLTSNNNRTNFRFQSKLKVNQSIKAIVDIEPIRKLEKKVGLKAPISIKDNEKSSKKFVKSNQKSSIPLKINKNEEIKCIIKKKSVQTKGKEVDRKIKSNRLEIFIYHNDSRQKSNLMDCSKGAKK